MTKNNIVRNILFCMVLSLTLLTPYSCSMEEAQKSESKEKEEVLLSVPFTRSGSPTDENRVHSARLIVVRSAAASQTDGGKVLVNSNTPVAIDPINEAWQQFKEFVQVGYIDMYIFVNELTSWNLASIAVGSTFNFNDIKSKTLTFTDYPAVGPTDPIPAFTFEQQLHIDQGGVVRKNGTPISQFEADRLFAKVLIKINCDFTDLPANEPIRLDSIYIRSMPKTSWMVAAPYTLTSPSDYFDGTYYTPANAFGTPYDDSFGFYHEYVFYIPEYLIRDVTKRTYITIVAHKEVAPLQRFHYTLVVGDGIPTKTVADMKTTTNTADLTITRNVCYTFNIVKIIGFGDLDDRTIHLEASVSNWQWQVIPVN